jgi:hypothetical protein
MSDTEHSDGYHSGENPIDMIPVWFSMLKELRNGTICYAVIVRRDGIRPPVRPVCRRLGVAKLSEIVNENLLYRALVQVAQQQSEGWLVSRGVEQGKTLLSLLSSLLIAPKS